jgi:hypothetical protein
LLQNSIFLESIPNGQHGNMVLVRISGQFLLKCFLVILQWSFWWFFSVDFPLETKPVLGLCFYWFCSVFYVLWLKS